jgi:hypothetical protein
MAQCKRCGQNAGMFKSFCEACDRLNAKDDRDRIARAKEIQEAKRKEFAEIEARRIAEVEAKKQEAISARVEQLFDQVRSGGRAFLYGSLYLAVDSIVNEEAMAGGFDVGELRSLGLDGWDIVGVIPRTLGLALNNRTVDPFGPTSYGGGMGGNVVGVHLLLRKELIAPSVERVDDEARNFVEIHGLY